MSDVHSPETRSYNMSRVRSKNTKPELLVRKRLHAAGFRFRLHDKALPGKPDLILPKYKTVIFIHGCFWHGHADCRYAALPKQNHAFWAEKIGANTERDKRQEAALEASGWRVLTVWTCALKPKVLENTLVGLCEIMRSTKEEYLSNYGRQTKL